jgi:hypothetical protein
MTVPSTGPASAPGATAGGASPRRERRAGLPADSPPLGGETLRGRLGPLPLPPTRGKPRPRPADPPKGGRSTCWPGTSVTTTTSSLTGATPLTPAVSSKPAVPLTPTTSDTAAGASLGPLASPPPRATSPIADPGAPACTAHDFSPAPATTRGRRGIGTGAGLVSPLTPTSAARSEAQSDCSNRKSRAALEGAAPGFEEPGPPAVAGAAGVARGAPPTRDGPAPPLAAVSPRSPPVRRLSSPKRQKPPSVTYAEAYTGGKKKRVPVIPL